MSNRSVQHPPENNRRTRNNDNRDRRKQPTTLVCRNAQAAAFRYWMHHSVGCGLVCPVKEIIALRFSTKFVVFVVVTGERWRWGLAIDTG
jgi:hypothetical protein